MAGRQSGSVFSGGPGLTLARRAGVCLLFGLSTGKDRMMYMSGKIRVLGFILMMVCAALCACIVWEYRQAAEEMSAFAALAEMVDERREDGMDTGDGDDSSNAHGEGEMMMREDQLTRRRLRPEGALLTASLGSLSGAGRLGVEDREGGKQVLPQYEDLHEQNPHLYGWIRIDGTKVNYPVMFSPDDSDRYLDKDFYGMKAKYGVPFIDGVTDVLGSRNLLIHGHNARSGILFGDLDRYVKQAFWKEHRYIRFDTLYEERLYEIVAVCRTSASKQGDGEVQYYDFANIWDSSS